MTDIKIKNLFDLKHTLAAEYLEGFDYPWEALEGIKDEILRLGTGLSADEYDHPEKDVWIAKDAVRYPNNYIKGPCIIGHETEIRPGAFVRGSALIGDGCVIGNSTEVKNAILFDGVQVPHFNYVGDSIMGYKSHLGAGSVTSNVKGNKKLVVIKGEDISIETGRKKVGAMVGDFVDVGCNSVLNPGTVIGRGTRVYPLSCVRGTVPEGMIYKSKNNVCEIK